MIHGSVPVSAGAVEHAARSHRLRPRLHGRVGVWVPGAFLAAIVIAAIAAPLLAPHDPQYTDLLSVLQGPSRAHPLGTDEIGRDVLSRLLYGSRVTLLGAFEAVLTFVIVGLPLGLVAGYLGSGVDRVVMSAMDIVLSMPVIILLLVVSAVFKGTLPLMVTLGIIATPGIVRVVRASTFAVRSELYVKSAEVVGLSRGRILRRHILPRVAGPALVQVTVFAAAAVVIECSLGYLGLDVNPPSPSWGSMVAEGATEIQQQSWLIVPSGLIITCTVLAVGLVGDAVRDASSRGRSVSSAAPRLERRSESPAEVHERIRDVLGGERREALLSVRDLVVSLNGQTMVDGVSFDAQAGRSLGIVGESGSGKTLTVLALLGLLPDGLEVTDGSVLFSGEEIVGTHRRVLASLRGRHIGYVSQDPLVALDPGRTVGDQLREAVRAGGRRTRGEARKRSLELLRQVELPNPETVARRYPHQLSGGMAQRVCIALALSGDPELVIADEPTTALDVTVQAEILVLLRALREQTGMALVIVTHDWGVVADSCDDTIVMYAGQIVERASVEELFASPRHPYTEALLAANPHLAADGPFEAIPGGVPPPERWPTGCRFRERCGYGQADCAAGPIPAYLVDTDHVSRCLHHEEVGSDLVR